MADDMNWEAQLDWSKIDPVGGLGFYNFVKGSILKSMDEGLGQLVAIKEDKEAKLRSWDEIAKVAQRLDEDFHRIVDAEIFKNTIRRIDERGRMIFPDGTTMTIRRWLEFGQVFTMTLTTGCRIPDDLKKDVAKTAGDIAKAETLRDFLKGYIEVAEMDFRLRNAPARFKTKLFRDTLRLVNALVATGEKVKVEVLPGFLEPLAAEVAKIKDMAARTQKTLRLVLSRSPPRSRSRAARTRTRRRSWRTSRVPRRTPRSATVSRPVPSPPRIARSPRKPSWRRRTANWRHLPRRRRGWRGVSPNSNAAGLNCGRF